MHLIRGVSCEPIVYNKYFLLVYQLDFVPNVYIKPNLIITINTYNFDYRNHALVRAFQFRSDIRCYIYINYCIIF